MPYKGIVRGNVVILEEGVRLPDGLRVIVEVDGDAECEPNFFKDPFLKVDEWLPEPAGEMPSDLAHQHDHYLYGTEKRR